MHAGMVGWMDAGVPKNNYNSVSECYIHIYNTCGYT